MQDDNNDYIPFPSINRNLAIYGNLILDNGADNFAYALDARTGELKWETQILDYRRGAQHSSGPIVANGKVISGRSCEPEGGPEACVLTAFDALTGKELWRTRTIPRPDEPGGDTWGDIPYEERRHVGLWMVPSFDPELNRIYVGTSVTSPAPKFMLAGNDEQYLYHNSTLAIDADTGKIVWYLQHNVDHWDLDHPFERILIDTAVAPDPAAVAWINPRVRSGQTHKVITGVPGKTGLVYTIDRETGQFLWARADRRAERHRVREHGVRRGRRQRREAVHGRESGDARVPEPHGRQELSRRRLQPRHEAHVHAAAEHLHDVDVDRADGRARTWELYAIRTRDQIAPGQQNVGTIEAITVETGRTAWKREQRAGQTSLMTTAGGLLFGGDTAGRFRAYDAETGAVLWEVNLGSHVTGFPGDVRRERQAVRRHQHGRDAEHVRPRDADAGNARGNREQPLRIRAARKRRW